MPSGRVFAGKKVDIGTINTLLGTVAVSGGGGGVQYSNGDTSIAATGTGTIFFGISSTTARAVKVASDGTVFVSGGGGGTQYVQNATDGKTTYTGTVVIGVDATTARALAIATTGGVSFVNTLNFLAAGTVTTLLGTVAISGTVSATPLGTATVNVVAATNFVVGGSVSLSGTGNVTVAGTPTVTVSTGVVSLSGTSNFILVSGTVSTVLALPIVTVTASANPIVISGTVTGLPSGTQTVAGSVSLSGTGTVIFGATQPISGSVSVINTPTVTIGGTANAFLLAGTAGVGGFRIIAHQSRFQALVVNTTSAAAGAIIVTSGAHTLYITDYLVSVDGPMQVDLCSETTALVTMYLATKGGAVSNQVNPVVCSSAKSFIVVCGSSGKCAVSCVGYTVT